MCCGPSGHHPENERNLEFSYLLTKGVPQMDEAPSTERWGAPRLREVTIGTGAMYLHSR